jgi:hypothetical protein
MSVVVWTEEALDRLSDIYVSVTAIQRVRLVDVVEEIDVRLSENSQFEGESRSGTNRVAFFPPLCVLYSVRPHQPVFIVRVSPLRFWNS